MLPDGRERFTHSGSERTGDLSQRIQHVLFAGCARLLVGKHIACVAVLGA